jgi:hypothetical protein
LITWIGQSLAVSDAWGSEMDYFGFKLGIVTATGLDMDALHVHAGIIVQLLAALILRRSLRSPLPWLVVLAAVLANEAYDLHYDPWPASQRAWQIAESVKDVWNTLAMPTLLVLLARFAPRLLTAPSHGDPNPEP